MKFETNHFWILNFFDVVISFSDVRHPRFKNCLVISWIFPHTSRPKKSKQTLLTFCRIFTRINRDSTDISYKIEHGPSENILRIAFQRKRPSINKDVGAFKAFVLKRNRLNCDRKSTRSMKSAMKRFQMPWPRNLC